MNQRQLIILSVCGVVLIGLAVWYFVLDRPPSLDALAAQALTAKEPKERIQAMAELALARERAIPELRRVAKETKDPAILALALTGLAEQNDSTSLPLFFDAMSHPENSVRRAAYAGVLRFYGGTLPDNLVYDPDAPTEAREMVVQRLKEYHKRHTNTPTKA